MLSYMLPTEEKPPVGSDLVHQHQKQQSYRSLRFASSDSVTLAQPGSAETSPQSHLQHHHNHHHHQQQQQPQQHRVTRTTSLNMFGHHRDSGPQPPRPGSAAPLLPAPVAAQPSPPATAVHVAATTATTTITADGSPKHNGAASTTTVRKSTLHTSKVAKDESLYSIDSDASTVGSERKTRTINGPKHANLKRVSFGSSKGSMVETLVYETPVQEEPEINHFVEHNGRIPAPMIPVPDTDEGREKVRVSLLGPKPFPSTPGVLLLEPIGPSIDIMAASPAELLTAHTDHTVPTYHTQISTDSGWDNPFRPDGDLSREADEIVELIKGGKPITPTPGQNGPALPGCERKTAADQLDASASPLLDGSKHQGNGNAHSTPIKPSGPQSANEKSTATVEVGRVTAQGPGDASQVEHVTLKKKPKCKCCVLQ